MMIGVSDVVVGVFVVWAACRILPYPILSYAMLYIYRCVDFRWEGIDFFIYIRPELELELELRGGGGSSFFCFRPAAVMGLILRVG